MPQIKEEASSAIVCVNLSYDIETSLSLFCNFGFSAIYVYDEDTLWQFAKRENQSIPTFSY